MCVHSPEIRYVAFIFARFSPAGQQLRNNADADTSDRRRWQDDDSARVRQSSCFMPSR